MRVKDVMTPRVISADPDEGVAEAAGRMLQYQISGLPVVDKKGCLIGMVTEGDFLRRGELGTQRRRPKWLEFVLGPGKLAQEYVHASGRKIKDVMTPDPWTIGEDESLEAVVDMMERRRIKRIPVTRDGRLVGIISRANLMHALASVARDVGPTDDSDSKIRDSIIATIASQNWAPHVNVIVKDGVAELYGVVMDDRERRGLVVAAETVSGVKRVVDHLVWVEPISGMAFSSTDDDAKEQAVR